MCALLGLMRVLWPDGHKGAGGMRVGVIMNGYGWVGWLCWVGVWDGHWVGWVGFGESGVGIV